MIETGVFISKTLCALHCIILCQYIKNPHSAYCHLLRRLPPHPWSSSPPSCSQAHLTYCHPLPFPGTGNADLLAGKRSKPFSKFKKKGLEWGKDTKDKHFNVKNEGGWRVHNLLLMDEPSILKGSGSAICPMFETWATGCNLNRSSLEALQLFLPARNEVK